MQDKVMREGVLRIHLTVYSSILNMKVNEDVLFHACFRKKKLGLYVAPVIVTNFHRL